MSLSKNVLSNETLNMYKLFYSNNLRTKIHILITPSNVVKLLYFCNEVHPNHIFFRGCRENADFIKYSVCGSSVFWLVQGVFIWLPINMKIHLKIRIKITKAIC